VRLIPSFLRPPPAMSATSPARAIEVRCPGCGHATLYSPLNTYRPFCSARCQGQDFGAWASEDYRVEAPPSTEELPDPPTTQPTND